MLAYEVTGAGPPLVLLHAGVADRRMWRDLTGPLGESFRVVAPDLRGFGESPLGTDAYSHTEDVVAVLDHLGVDSASLVGASLGALVALQVAHAAPERVRALVLAAPPLPGWNWSAEVTDFWEAEDAALERGDLDAAAEANVDLWAGGHPEVASRVRQMQRRAFDLQLHATAQERDDDPVDPAAIRARTLIVVGSSDLPDFAGIADHLATVMPNAGKLVVDDAGHLVAMQRPAEFAAIVTGFLSQDG